MGTWSFCAQVEYSLHQVTTELDITVFTTSFFLLVVLTVTTLDLIYSQPTHDPVCCICASDKLLILVSVLNSIFPVFLVVLAHLVSFLSGLCLFFEYNKWEVSNKQLVFKTMAHWLTEFEFTDLVTHWLLAIWLTNSLTHWLTDILADYLTVWLTY